MVHCHIAKNGEKAAFTMALVSDSNALKTIFGDERFSKPLKKKLSSDEQVVYVTMGEETCAAWKPGTGTKPWATAEKLRKVGAELRNRMKAEDANDLLIINESELKGAAAHIAEGFILSDYAFDKYLTSDKSKSKTKFKIGVRDPGVNKALLSQITRTADAVFAVRNLVNEPQNVLTATKLAEFVKESGKTHGFKVEILNKKKIESLKMGGLLAVNQGSIEPPTFTVAEWKPEKAMNKQPIVLVGKGVVYDTGGLSLKPTPNSMDLMKCDMAGAGAVIGIMQALAANRVPLHVVALIPATDNRPSLNAYAPGDIITMMSGTTVEVLNTDAEGRLILADALHYAKGLKPELVIDLATLTGAAVRALGSGVSAAMGTADQADFDLLFEAGLDVMERVVWFPLWDDYKDQLKSSVADITNLGGAEAGHITAGKFLEHFTEYPWMHIDIAGPAFLTKPESYIPKGGTGVGVRLVVEFLTKKYLSEK